MLHTSCHAKSAFVSRDFVSFDMNRISLLLSPLKAFQLSCRLARQSGVSLPGCAGPFS